MVMFVVPDAPIILETYLFPDVYPLTTHDGALDQIPDMKFAL